MFQRASTLRRFSALSEVPDWAQLFRLINTFLFYFLVFNLSPPLAAAILECRGNQAFLMLTAMFALALLAALAVLDGCMALGGLQYIRPPPSPSVRSLVYRASLESIDEKDVINVGNSTSANTTSVAPNAAIIPVVYSSVDQ